MKKNLFPILVVILILPATLALFHKGFFLTDDGNSMIIRFSAFYEALRNGQFPVRFLPRLNYEYGYPVADFLYPLFMYLGVPIHVIGFDFTTSIKIIFGTSLIFSGLFSFFWLKKYFSDISATVGAIVYSLFPYHLWDIYKRGSVGEVLALAITPFILWQIENESIALSGIGIGLLILSHNVLALLFLPIILLYIIFARKLSFLKTGVIFLLGFGISSFFWIPALLDKQYTIFDKTIVSDFSKYFIFPDSYSLLGFITLVVILLSLYCLLLRRKVLYWFFWIVAIISIFFSFPFSKILWQHIPGTYFIQFPFRLLSITALGVGLLSSVVVESIKEKSTFIVAILFLILSYFSAKDFFAPQVFQAYPDTFYSTNVDSTTVKSEYMPVWVKTSAKVIPGERVFLSFGNGVINNVSSNGNAVRFDAIVTKPSIVQVNTVYFPGWKAIVDQKEQNINYDNTYGVIQIPLETGSHAILVKFTETASRLICDIISIVFFITLIVIFFIEKRTYEVK